MMTYPKLKKTGKNHLDNKIFKKGCYFKYLK